MQSTFRPSLPLLHSGKVRDTYEIPGHKDLLLMVASDRLSTHNIVHESLVPKKGEYLTALTVFWANTVLNGVDHHLVAKGREIYRYLRVAHRPSGEYPDGFRFRAVVVRRRKVTPVEFIYRDYLCGSLWRLYQKGEDPYRLRLIPGLPLMHRFQETIFTPTQKSATDDPLPSRFVQKNAPAEVKVTTEVFNRGRAYLAERGITLIDFKAEASGKVLVDEWLNGDCCRMAWTKDLHAGVEPPFLDKEVFRQAAMRQWGKGPKVPLTFGEQTLRRGVKRYRDGFEAITGQSLSNFQRFELD
jgi:phosphoribosylaminoimidazole-succinocarboxamide synthase